MSQQIVYKPLSEVTQYGDNNKVHTEEQIEAIAESITKYGFGTPLLIDKENVIIAGHGRYLASQKLGLTEIPCLIADKMTAKEVAQYRIVDNAIGDVVNSPYDLHAIRQEITEIDDIFLKSIFPKMFQAEKEEAGEGYDDYSKHGGHEAPLEDQIIKQIILQFTTEEFVAFTDNMEILEKKFNEPDWSILLYTLVMDEKVVS